MGSDVTPEPLQCRIDQVTFGLKAFESDFLARSIVRDGLWERHLSYAIPGSLKPGSVFFDIGANVGYYTVLASKILGPAGKIVAVEPSPRIVEVLEENVAREARSPVIVEALAVGAEPGRARLHFDESESGASYLGPDGGDGDEVEVVTLDVLAARHGLPDVIKADVEGLEGDLLTGGRRTLEDGGPAVFMEFAPQNFSRSRTSLIDALKHLEAIGYRFGMFRGHSTSARMPIRLSMLVELTEYCLSIGYQGHMDIVIGRPSAR